MKKVAKKTPIVYIKLMVESIEVEVCVQYGMLMEVIRTDGCVHCIEVCNPKIIQAYRNLAA
jgi:hypothetical protein